MLQLYSSSSLLLLAHHIEEKDIELEVHGNLLSIKAQWEHESKDDNKDEKRGYYGIERHYGMFRRVLQLPEDADADKIIARAIKTAC